MSLLDDEIDSNFAAFRNDWTKQIDANWKALKGERHFAESYRRITCLNSIKNTLVQPSLSSGSAQFFFEAHNDALVSHVAASIGSWRSALQSLRSCIENALLALYYMDHPVELRLWEAGQQRISFNELFKYFERHPLLCELDKRITGLDILSAEYSTLSKAVHGSAINFRMTAAEGTLLLWNTDKVKASMWATRERAALQGLALIVVCLFRERLTTTKNTPLRESFAYTISPCKRAIIKSELHVSIP